MQSKNDIDIKIEYCKPIAAGIQDAALNRLMDNLVICNGFQTGRICSSNLTFNSKDKLCKESKYIRGFKDFIQIYNIKNQDCSVIKSIISRRQSSLSVKIDDSIYIWGGFSYTPLTDHELNTLKSIPQKKDIATYIDSYEIKIDKGKLSQKKIASNLPYPICDGRVINHKDKIFFLGGGIYKYPYGFSTNFVVNNNITIGKGFFYMLYDKKNKKIKDEIIYLNNFPGIERMNHIFFEHKDFLYVMGGTNISDDVDRSKGWSEYVPNNVIDNWKYDIEKNKWIKLENMPFLLTGSGYIKYKEKYLVIIGGCKYNNTILENNKKVKTCNIENNFFDFKLEFNNISDIKMEKKKNGVSSYNYYFSNIIIIYDIENNKFMLPSKRLDFNINNPKLVTHNDDIYIITGEMNPVLLNDVYYGEHPSLVCKLKIYF